MRVLKEEGKLEDVYLPAHVAWMKEEILEVK